MAPDMSRIGEPDKIIEIEPVELPDREPHPAESPEPPREPVPEKEPEKIPA
jgi:hypothetical protein